MSTRRQKLRSIFAEAVIADLSAQDLLDDIERFTASGESGVETWINSRYENGLDAAQGEVQVDLETVKAHLKQALATLNA